MYCGEERDDVGERYTRRQDMPQSTYLLKRALSEVVNSCVGCLLALEAAAVGVDEVL